MSSLSLTRWRLPQWQTWLLLLTVYGSWLVLIRYAVWLDQHSSPLLTNALLATVLAWYMSAQHELLHGHPTRWDTVNRSLGLAPLAVWYPYDVYRRSHLAHHHDESLTQPHADPESNYLDTATFSAMPAHRRITHVLLRTLLGRLLLGPAFAIAGTTLDAVRQLRHGGVDARSWAEHLLLLALLLWGLAYWADISPIRYLFGVAYPALGLSMLRSFYEHRPALLPAHRIAINEAGWGWRLLYLNNNYHLVHHEQPSLPWYRLPAVYRANRSSLLARNGGFLVPGYGYLLRHHLLRTIDSPAHPGCPIPHHCAVDQPSTQLV